MWKKRGKEKEEYWHEEREREAGHVTSGFISLKYNHSSSYIYIYISYLSLYGTS